MAHRSMLEVKNDLSHLQKLIAISLGREPIPDYTSLDCATTEERKNLLEYINNCRDSGKKSLKFFREKTRQWGEIDLTRKYKISWDSNDDMIVSYD